MYKSFWKWHFSDDKPVRSMVPVCTVHTPKHALKIINLNQRKSPAIHNISIEEMLQTARIVSFIINALQPLDLDVCDKEKCIQKLVDVDKNDSQTMHNE